jgi:hypothetical protein
MKSILMSINSVVATSSARNSPRLAIFSVLHR